ncbi:MAG: fibronectin type III domain-containing protein [Flavobacteriales bacterium]
MLQRLPHLLASIAFAPQLFAINPPTLQSPCAPGPLYDPALPIQFAWSASSGAVNYQMQISMDPSFTFTSIDETTTATWIDIWAALSYDARYYWRARANDGSIWSAWSSNCDFYTMPLPAPPAPVLQAPPNNSIGLSTTVGLQWSQIPATAIEINYSTTSNFATYTVVNTGGQNHTLNGLLNGQTYYWRVRGSNIGGTGPWSAVWTFTTGSVATSLNLRMYLQGPWNTVTLMMNDNLRTAALVPNAEPYSGLGYTGLTNTGATIGAGLLGVSGGNAIVDWVLVEARHATSNTILQRWAMLLQRDGDVTMPNGSVPSLVFPMGQVRIAVRHRNHLGCMASTVFAANGTAIPADLTLPATAMFGTDPTATVSGSRALWAGDVTGDSQVKYTGTVNDRDPILQAVGGTLPTNTVVGYGASDVNLDGVIKYTGANNDRDIILTVVGGTVPTAVRAAQLP